MASTGISIPGVAVGVSLSNTAVLIGGLTVALIGGYCLFKHTDKKVRVSYAAEAVTQEGVEDQMFATVLANADRSTTVLENEDRIREYITRMRPMIKDLVDQYLGGRITHQELMREIRAMTIQIHHDLNIPFRYGADNTFYPPKSKHPKHHGHHRVQNNWNMGYGMGDQRNNARDPSTIPVVGSIGAGQLPRPSALSSATIIDGTLDYR